MTLKEFLNPNKEKLLLSIIIFIFLPVFPVLINVVCDSMPGFNEGGCPSNYTEYFSFLTLLIKGFNNINISIIPILGFVFAYIVASAVIFYIEQISFETKQQIKENLKMTKTKLLFSALGWLSIGIFFTGYLSGIYGGTSNFPALLSSVHYFFDSLALVILPFTAVTYYLFYNSSVIFLGLLSYFSNIEHIFGGLEPHTLTFLGALIIFPLLIIEWYLFSCLSVYYYNKIKHKTQESSQSNDSTKNEHCDVV